MKIKSEILKSLIEEISPVMGKGKTMPILDNVILKVKNGTLAMKGTNLEVFIEVSELVETSDEMEILLDFQKLKKIIETSKCEELDFKETNENIMINAGKVKHKIGKTNFNLEDYPEYPALTDPQMFKINFAGLSKCLPSIGSEYQKSLYGIHFCTNNFISTDGFRLCNVETKNELPFEFTIPPLFSKILSNLTGDFNAFTNQSTLIITGQNIKISGHFNTEAFPKWQEVLEKKSEHYVRFNRKDMINILKAVSLNLDRDTHKIEFKIENDAKKMTVKSTDEATKSESISEIDIEADASETIMFSGIFFSQLLNNFDDEVIELGFSTPHSQALVKSNNQTYLLMPLRIG